MDLSPPLSIKEIEEVSPKIFGKKIRSSTISKYVSSGIGKLFRHLQENLQEDPVEVLQCLSIGLQTSVEEVWRYIPREIKKSIFIPFLEKKFPNLPRERIKEVVLSDSFLKGGDDMSRKILYCERCGREVSVDKKTTSVLCSRCLLGMAYRESEGNTTEKKGESEGKEKKTSPKEDKVSPKESKGVRGKKKVRKNNRGTKSYKQDPLKLEVVNHMKGKKPVSINALERLLSRLDDKLIFLHYEGSFLKLDLSIRGKLLEVDFTPIPEINPLGENLYSYAKTRKLGGMTAYHLARSLKEAGVKGTIYVRE